jgi:hypothetical protein
VAGGGPNTIETECSRRRQLESAVNAHAGTARGRYRSRLLISFAPAHGETTGSTEFTNFREGSSPCLNGLASLFLSLAEKSLYELFRLDFKGIADAKQGDERGRASGLDHLPMPHAESVGNHVLLAQFAFRPV